MIRRNSLIRRQPNKDIYDEFQLLKLVRFSDKSFDYYKMNSYCDWDYCDNIGLDRVKDILSDGDIYIKVKNND